MRDTGRPGATGGVAVRERRAVSALFPPAAECRDIDAWLSETLAQAHARVADGRVDATSGHAAAEWDFSPWDFAAARDPREVMGWVVQALEHGIVHVTHPRYFGLFNPAPSHAARCADAIVAAFNPQLASATTSPFPVALERHVIRSMAARAGYEAAAAAGHFTSGGSEANGAALGCALTAALPGFAVSGARAFSGPPAIYISVDSHLAWIKLAHQAGIGRDAVRLVDVDSAGRMDAGALRAMMAADREAGCVPVLVVSTAGTTSGGAIDPISACGRVAAEFGAWHHVDAAWGGAVLASRTHRHLLDGVAQADSLTIDAHKWLATTMGCGMFMTRHASMVQETFRVTMDCMPSRDTVLDPYVTSTQWSRRFLGLRLFLGLAVAGWDGYGRHVDQAIAQARDIGERLGELGWVCVNTPALAVLCLEPPPGSSPPADIARRVVAEGNAWVSSVTFAGRKVLRVCVTNGTTGPADIDTLVECLQRHRV